jgi:hypothetical protein
VGEASGALFSGWLTGATSGFAGATFSAGPSGVAALTVLGSVMGIFLSIYQKYFSDVYYIVAVI